jgi:hypothetical protein
MELTVFFTGNKIFCGTGIDGLFRTGTKCDEFDFGDLIERQGVAMPRLSSTYWIRIEKGKALSKPEWKRT